MTTTAPSASLLTPELIESVIGSLPIQGRIMLRLMLLQHFDVTEEEIRYMTADRPDPRCVAGSKPTHNVLTQDAIKSVTDKRDQYLRHVRLKRERTRLQCDCLTKLAAVRTAMAERAAELLSSRFSLDREAIAELTRQARTALPKPALRALEQRWDNHEITAEEYQGQRLGIELQTQLRLAEKYRKRLDLADRERHTADMTSLQDHEVCHIWGLPAGSLAARKVKYMTQYLQALQAALHRDGATGSQTAPVDLWKETFAVLATRPVERSMSVYDGLERTETLLLEKLTAMAAGQLTEDVESKFWLSLVQGASSNAVHSEITRSLFGLQRLAAILNDFDSSPEALDEALLARTAPKSQETQAQLPDKSAEPVSNEMKEHILKSMFGEQHPDLAGGGKW